MSVTAKTLILDLLMVANRPLTVKNLLASGSLFGLPANNMRVTLARLSAEGLMESVGRGTYQLTAKANQVAADVAKWRTACQRLKPWSGDYLTVHCGALGRSDRAALRQRTRAMSLLGFKELERGLHLRPDNLEGGIEQVRRRLYTLGLELDANVFVSSHFDDERKARIAQLWNGDSYHLTYQRQKALLQEWMVKAPNLAIEDATRESYLLGSQAIRDVVFDPLLPEPMVNAQARQEFVDTVVAFDHFGHAIWHRFHADSITP